MGTLFGAAWFLFLRKWITRLIVIFLTLSIVSVVLFKWVNPPITLNMIGHRISSGKPLLREWKNLDQISKKMQLAAICGEDQNFNSHYGFDLAAIKAAAMSNAQGGKVRGASTISQQTAKNTFLWNGGGYFRKAFEAWFTFLIETIWGKKRIMEVYLNVAETGNGMYGVEAASQKYFGKPAKNLSTSEAAAISSIFPSPKRWAIGRYPASSRQRLIYTAMTHYGIQLEYLK